jgi:pimeloyl-ACP methyl ester carboxylesterase
LRILAAVLAMALTASGAQAQLTPLGQKPAQPKQLAATTPLWQTVKDPAKMPFTRETGFVAVDDVQIHYAIYGKGKPVILLHDALGNADHWGNQVGPLSQGRQVIVIDARGHGRSSRGKKPFSYALMAGDVISVMQKLGIREAAVVGWGDGAVVALELAMRNPGRIREAILFGGNYNLSGLKPGAEQTPTFAAYARKAISDYNTLSPDPNFDKLFTDLRTMWTKEPNYTPEQLGQIKVKVDIVIAEYEEIVKREHAETMVRLIPDSQVVMLPGVSHFAPWQNSRKFSDVIGVLLDY